MKAIATVAVIAALTTGCSTWGNMSRADKGTVIGAGAGAAVGNAVTGGGVLGTVGGAAVGGVVGMIGGLGGFVLPIVFGWLKDATGLWSSCFMVLFLIVAACFAWMHLTVRRLDRAPAGQPA